MTMNQNSSSYSENSQIDIQLDPAIQGFIAPNVKGSVEVKFDGYGTLHVLERDSEGALLSDSFLAKQEYDEPKNIINDYTNAEKLEDLMRSNSRLNLAVKAQKWAVIIFAILFLLFCILLKLTLQMQM